MNVYQTICNLAKTMSRCLWKKDRDYIKSQIDLIVQYELKDNKTSRIKELEDKVDKLYLKQGFSG